MWQTIKKSFIPKANTSTKQMVTIQIMFTMDLCKSYIGALYIYKRVLVLNDHGRTVMHFFFSNINYTVHFAHSTPFEFTGEEMSD